MPQQSNWLDQYLVRETASAPPQAAGGSFASPAATAPTATWLDQFAVKPPADSARVPSSFAMVNGQPVANEPDDEPTWMDSATNFFKEALKSVNPIAINQGMADALWDPRGALAGILNAQGEVGAKAKAEFEKGNYAQGARHAINWLLPVVGPRLDQAGDFMQEGEFAKGLGATVDVAGQVAGPKAVGNLTRGGVKVPALVKNPNPVDAAAVQAGLRAGVPVDAATASGNPYVRGVQRLSEHTTLAGAHVGQQAAAGAAAGLSDWGAALANKVAPGPARTIEQAGESLQTSIAARAARDAAGRGRAGERLAGKVHPTAVARETAGQGTRDSIAVRRGALHEEAGVAYDGLRAIEADPANAVSIPEMITLPTSSGTPLRVPSGQTTTVALPVDQTAAKAAFAPLREHLLQTMPLAQRQASPGLLAIENILNGPDMVPLSVADANLSALKRIARQASSPDTANVSQGLAKAAISQLDAAVQRAATKAGPEATRLLREGRNAVKAKYAAQEVLEALHTEPVRVVDQLTRPRDVALRQLQDVQKLAPAEMPKIARAYVDGLLEADAGTATRQWQQLGAQSKAILIQDPKLRQALDTFFRPGPGPAGSAAEVLKTLPQEPVRVLTQATYAKDAGIAKLDALARLAPEQMPVVGRALLDDMLGQATAKGGFDGAAGLKRQWDQLGPRTKQALFKDTAHVRELDHFFHLASRMNPSLGSPTAYLMGMGAHAWNFTNPVSFAVQELTGATVAKLLHSPAGVKALTRGMTASVGNKAAATAAYGNLARTLATVERPGMATLVPSHATAPATGAPPPPERRP